MQTDSEPGEHYGRLATSLAVILQKQLRRTVTRSVTHQVSLDVHRLADTDAGHVPHVIPSESTPPLLLLPHLQTAGRTLCSVTEAQDPATGDRVGRMITLPLHLDRTHMIRTLHPKDCPLLKDLHERVWGIPPQGRRQLSLQYDHLFPRLFLQNPWFDPEVSSLVSETDGQIDALIAVMSRTMFLNDRPIRMAVSTQFCADESARRKLIPGRLIQKLLRGPQDLTIADDCSEDAARLLQAFGAVSVPTLALRWVRPLRPLACVPAVLGRHPRLRRLMTPARWLSSNLDRLLGTTQRWPGEVLPAPHENIPLTRELVTQQFDRLTDDIALRPRYTASDIDWNWHQMSRVAESAPIRRRAVVDSSHRLLGWYAYQVVPHDIGLVIHFTAEHGHRDAVFQTLVADADSHALAGLGGIVPPGMSALDLTQHRCLISARDACCMIHTRDDEIRDAMQRGDVYLSPLEGEVCLNLGLRTADLPPVRTEQREPVSNESPSPAGGVGREKSPGLDS